jgi:SAM-dependent methyltransferase
MALHTAEAIKSDILKFYNAQSGDKTSDLEEWLNSGDARIPQSKTYYYFEDRKIDHALKMAGLKPRSSILEVGCNLGQMTFVLAKMGFNITGVDLSDNAIRKAQLRAEHYQVHNARFISHDGESLDFLKPGSFDAVFSFSTIRYMPSPLAALRQMLEIVKPGGCVVADFPNRYCPWFSLLKPLVLIPRHIHDNYFSAKQIVDLMTTAGFRNIEFSFLLFAHKGLPPFTVPALKLADFLLERTPLIRRMAAIIMVKGVKE